MMKKTLGSVFAVLMLGFPLQVQASSITILNAGFESPTTGSTATPVTSWTLLGGGGGGTWNIISYTLGYWTVPAPQGMQVAWLSDAPHPGTPATLSQVLGAVLTANTVYTLSGYVGHPIGFATIDGTPGGAPTIYTASLYAGTNLLASTSGTGPSGTFAPFSFVFNSAGSPFIGQALQIQLSSNQAQTSYDAISLTTPDGGMTVLLLGMGLASLGLIRRRMA